MTFYTIVICPNNFCCQSLEVPKDKGNLIITCPRCYTRFDYFPNKTCGDRKEKSETIRDNKTTQNIRTPHSTGKCFYCGKMFRVHDSFKILDDVTYKNTCEGNLHLECSYHGAICDSCVNESGSDYFISRDYYQSPHELKCPLCKEILGMSCLGRICYVERDKFQHSPPYTGKCYICGKKFGDRWKINYDPATMCDSYGGTFRCSKHGDICRDCVKDIHSGYPGASVHSYYCPKCNEFVGEWQSID